MSFLQRLSKIFSKEKAEQLEVALVLSEVSDFLAKHSDKTREIEARAQEHKQALRYQFDSLKKSISVLESAKPSLKGDYPRKVWVSGEDIRDRFCEEISRMFSNPPDAIQELFLLSQRIFSVLNLDVRRAELLTMLFAPEMKELYEETVELKKEIISFGRFIKKDFEIIQNSDKVKIILSEIENEKRGTENLNRDISKISKEIEFSENKKQNIADKLKETQKNEKEATSELDKEINEVEKKSAGLHAEINEIFLEIKKVLKKFMHFVDKEKYSVNKRVLNEYLKSPSQALLADENLQIFDILSKLKLALDKEIKLDEKQKGKILAGISSLTKEYIEDAQSKYSINQAMLQENQNQKTQVLMPLVFKEKALEREYAEMERYTAERSQELSRKDKLKTRAEECLNDKIRQLALLMSGITGVSVKIAC